MEDNISVPIFVESRYKVSRKKIKKTVEEALKREGVSGPCEVSVAIVGNRKMHYLNKTYRNIDKSTNVLSFSQIEGEPTVLPKDKKFKEKTGLFLGDIIISYPYIIKEASEQNVLVDTYICELVEHGLMHLLGKHHR